MQHRRTNQDRTPHNRPEQALCCETEPLRSVLQHRAHGGRATGGRSCRLLAIGAISLALVTVAACGSGDDAGESSSSGDASTEVQRAADAGAMATDEDGLATTTNTAASGAGGGDQALTATPELAVAAAGDRQQVFTAAADVKVESLDAAVAEAAGAIGGLGRFAATEDVDVAGSNLATIVYRVPAPQFRPALTALSRIGELRSQTIDSSDVTAQYADLEGRVTTLRTSIGRLQGFLGETTDVNQVASLEGELTRRESELESIEAQRRALADQVDLSTITVSFDATTASPATTSDRAGFSGGLDAGWDVAAGIVAGSMATVGFLLPFVPLLLVVAGLVRWFRRRTRRAAQELSPTL